MLPVEVLTLCLQRLQDENEALKRQIMIISDENQLVPKNVSLVVSCFPTTSINNDACRTFLSPGQRKSLTLKLQSLTLLISKLQVRKLLLIDLDRMIGKKIGNIWEYIVRMVLRGECTQGVYSRRMSVDDCIEDNLSVDGSYLLIFFTAQKRKIGRNAQRTDQCRNSSSDTEQTSRDGQVYAGYEDYLAKPPRHLVSPLFISSSSSSAVYTVLVLLLLFSFSSPPLLLSSSPPLLLSSSHLFTFTSIC
eukprot:768286-Hanusia_phi.AAC.2